MSSPNPLLDAGVWTRDTFCDPLRFPSLVLVSIFNNIDLNEQELLHEIDRERKGYNWHKCEGKVPAISSPISEQAMRTAARRDAQSMMQRTSARPAALPCPASAVPASTKTCRP
jgi:hypothetical protein